MKTISKTSAKSVNYPADLTGSVTLVVTILALIGICTAAHGQSQGWGDTRERGVPYNTQNYDDDDSYDHQAQMNDHDHDMRDHDQSMHDRDHNWNNNSDNSLNVMKSRTNDEYLYTIDLPGVRKEDIHITENNGLLTIYGNRMPPQTNGTSDEQMMANAQNNPGYFNRTLNLPRDARIDKVSADFKDGVLTIHVGRRRDTSPRNISIG